MNRLKLLLFKLMHGKEPKKYSDRIKLWALEYEVRAHTLTERELETMTNDAYFEFMKDK